MNYAIGIDVSKAKLDICLCSELNQVQKLCVANTEKGYTELVAWLKDQSVSQAPVLLESTGDYHIAVSMFLTKHAFLVYVCNPLVTAKYLRYALRKVKTDTVDALALAQLYFHPHFELPQLFTRSVPSMMRQKQLSIIHLLETQIQAMKQNLAQYEQTRNSLAAQECPQVEAIKLSITTLEKRVFELKQSLATNITHQDKQRIARMKGVSPITAGLVLAHLEGKVFNNKKQLVAYVGLDISVRQSGQWVGRSKLTKRGNSHLRKLLWQVAWGLKTHDPVFQAYYQRLREAGRSYKESLVIIARKFLHILFAMMKYHQDYDPSKLAIA